jgi:apolipoprotein N-acyltransferase
MVVTVRARRSCLAAYACGLAGHVVGFHWVYETVSVFGGFGVLPSALVFALFVASGALQFLLFAVVHRHLGSGLDRFALRAPVAWVLAELVTPRLFAWHLGHTQIAFTAFAQAAGLGGAMLVSFLMVWIVEAGVRVLFFRERRVGYAVPAVALVLSLAYGVVTIRTFTAPAKETQEVVLVQAEAALAERHDFESARQYLAGLYDLTRHASRSGALVVWPEGAIPANIPDEIRSVRETLALPDLGDGSALLLGSYAFDRERRRYNAAFAIEPDGTVPSPYFKRVLIPFGESMPFASIIPWLDRLNPNASVFTAGTGPRVFHLRLDRSDGSHHIVRVSPLICYEDTMPSLARESTRAGAELLVNLTSDSWFGRSPALPQHHLIASFRAIENRRYLVRATTTGLTAIVDPLGRTIARIEPFTVGTARAQVALLRYRSFYTDVLGDWVWWFLLGGCVASVLGRCFHGARRRASKKKEKALPAFGRISQLSRGG